MRSHEQCCDDREWRQLTSRGRVKIRKSIACVSHRQSIVWVENVQRERAIQTCVEPRNYQARSIASIEAKLWYWLTPKSFKPSSLQQFEIKPATKMVNFKDVKKGDYLEMAAYSIDLRQKILIAWPNKEGRQRELAKRFKVSLSFLRDFLRRYRETAQIAARTLLRRSPLEA